MRIGNRIHEIRGDTPLRIVAARADLPETSVSRIAASNGPGPHLLTAFRIAQAVGAEIGEVFFRIGDQEPDKAT